MTLLLCPSSQSSAVTAPAPDNPFRNAQFVISAARLAQLPEDAIGEIAFVGRSNAGKSSALNAICEHRGLARVSKTPGRTQLINLFATPGGGRLVDLPGYGFAQAPLALKREWGALVGGYIEQRQNLRGLVLVMDIRHPLTELDRQMLGWCRARGCAVHLLLTKSDKLRFGARRQSLLEARRELKTLGEGFSVQTFSALNRDGVEEVREKIASLLV